MLHSNTLWAMEPARLELMMKEASRLAIPTARQIDAARRAAVKKLGKVSGKIAVLPVRGVIEQRLGIWGYYFGGVGCDDLGRAVDALMANKDVAAVVLDIDSPGGSTCGVRELADKLMRHRGKKQLVAVANSLACSAAYWIGCSCDQFYATPGADVGSIGVYCTHEDVSVAMQESGVKVSFIQAGKYKTEGNSYEPLTDEAKTHLQSLVDDSYSQFVNGVAAARGVSAKEVRSGYGEGRFFTASQALERKMIDKVMTLEEVLQKLGALPASDVQQARGVSTHVLKLRQEHRKRKGVA